MNPLPLFQIMGPPFDGDDEDEQETSRGPVRRDLLDVAFIFTVCLLFGGSASVLLWAVAEMFVP